MHNWPCLVLAASTVTTVGGGPVRPGENGPEKDLTPTVTKEVGEAGSDGQINYQPSMDTSVSKSVPFRLTGTLPSNWDEFETYSYSFVDTLDTCMSVPKDSVKVYHKHLDDTGKEARDDITEMADICLLYTSDAADD